MCLPGLVSAFVADGRRQKSIVCPTGIDRLSLDLNRTSAFPGKRLYEIDQLLRREGRTFYYGRQMSGAIYDRSGGRVRDRAFFRPENHAEMSGYFSDFVRRAGEKMPVAGVGTPALRVIGQHLRRVVLRVEGN